MAASNSVPVRIRLLGGFELTSTRAGVSVPIRKRMRALIALIAMAPPIGQSRETLASILWGDRDEEQARGSLRQALAELRRIVGEDALCSDREFIAFDSAIVAVDAVEFVQATTAARWEEAAILYQGDLLAGVEVPAGEFFN